MLRVILNLLVCFLLINFVNGQTNRLDCFSGNYYTQSHGVIVADAMEQNNIDTVHKLPVKHRGNVKVDNIFLRFKKLYGRLKLPIEKARVEMIEPAGDDGNCFYERTYYRIEKNRIIYTFQIRSYFDLDGNLINIDVLDQGKITRRDKIVRKKLRDKQDFIPPPPPPPPRFPGT